MFFKVPEAELSKDEAEKLSAAAANVARWYEVPTLAQKTLDWISLLSVGAAVYGPRFGAFRVRKFLEAQNKKADAQHKAAASQGVPIVQRDNMPQGATPAAPPAPSKPKGNGGLPSARPGVKPPPYSADAGMALEQGGDFVSGNPLAMIIPDGGFTN